MRWLLRGPAVGFSGALVTLAVLWLLFHYKPAWYREAILKNPNPQQARAEALETVGEFSDRMAMGRPFRVELYDDSVNHWLAILDELSPEAARALPTRSAVPVVRFRDGYIGVASLFRTDRWEAIINGQFTAEVTADGGGLVVRLTQVSVGAVPLPAFLRGRLLGPSLGEAVGPEGNVHDVRQDLHEALEQTRAAYSCVDCVALENRFVWFNGERPFRIAWIKIGEGKLEMEIIPL